MKKDYLGGSSQHLAPSAQENEFARHRGRAYRDFGFLCNELPAVEPVFTREEVQALVDASLISCGDVLELLYLCYTEQDDINRKHVPHHKYSHKDILLYKKWLGANVVISERRKA